MNIENISLADSLAILEEILTIDDSIYAYNPKYRLALEFIIDYVKRDDPVVREIADYVGGYTCTNSLELSNDIMEKWGNKSKLNARYGKSVNPEMVKGTMDYKMLQRLDNLHIETRPISPEQKNAMSYYNMAVDDCIRVVRAYLESVKK